MKKLKKRGSEMKKITNKRFKLFRDTLLIISIISIIFSFFLSFSYIDNPKIINIIISLPFFLFLTPYLFLRLYELKMVSTKMNIVPRFFRDIVDNVNSGLSLINAINVCLNNDYDILNNDIKKLYNKINWGINFETAILDFADDVGSNDLKKDMILIVEAKKVGGHVENMLKDISEKINTDIVRKKEIKNNLASNTITGYISFCIFLFIIVITFNNLFVNLENATMSNDGDNSIISGGNMDKINIFKSLLTILAYEMSILSGLLFGFMSEENLISGAPHVVALITITFLTFFFFV